MNDKITPQQQIVNHQAIVRIDVVVNAQMPDGQWHPRSLFCDNFFLRIEGSSEVEIIQNLKDKLQTVKEKWTENGGEIGVYHDTQS